jgi:hypothetical protein
MADQSFVWFRYISHLMPFLIAVAIAPLGWLLGWMSERVGRPALGTALATVLVLAFFGAHFHADRYALGARHAYNMHPWFMYLTPDRISPDLQPLSPFYRKPFPPGAIIEAPVALVFPLYGVYQRIHHREVYAGAVRKGYWQDLFLRQADLDFSRVIDLETLAQSDSPPGASLLIWHKRIHKELYRAMNATMESWPAALHSPRPRWFLEFLDIEFGRQQLELPEGIRRRFRVVYEDPVITVFDLRANSQK